MRANTWVPPEWMNETTPPGVRCFLVLLSLSAFPYPLSFPIYSKLTSDVTSCRNMKRYTEEEHRKEKWPLL